MKPKCKHNLTMNLLRALLLPVAACVLLVAGCATQAPPVTSYVDESTGLRTDLLADNLLDSPTSPPREVVYLNASRFFKSASQSAYYLEVTYIAKEDVGLLDISFGETLTLVLDGKPVKFSGLGSLNTRKNLKNGLIQETALYETNRDQMQKIAAAKEVEVQIKGRNGLILRKFNQANKDKFRLFVLTYAG